MSQFDLGRRSSPNRPNRSRGRLRRSRPTNPSLRAEKKEDLAQLEAALKNAKPIQFKENIALVLKYFDKLAPLMQEQDANLRPAD